MLDAGLLCGSSLHWYSIFGHVLKVAENLWFFCTVIPKDKMIYR